MPRVFASIALCIGLLCGGGAQAQGDVEAEARRLFAAGVEHGQAERWVAAADAFQRSLSLIERHSTRFNLVVALHRSEQYGDLIEAAERFLAAPAGQIASADRAEVERLLGIAQARLGQLTLHVTPPQAAMWLGETMLSEGGAVRRHWFEPGAHLLTLRAQGYEESRLELTLQAAQRLERRVVLEPVAPEATPEVSVERESAPVEQQSARVRSTGPLPRTHTDTTIWSEPWLWIAAGAGVAAAVAVGVIVASDSSGPQHGGSTMVRF